MSAPRILHRRDCFRKGGKRGVGKVLSQIGSSRLIEGTEFKGLGTANTIEPWSSSNRGAGSDDWVKRDCKRLEKQTEEKLKMWQLVSQQAVHRLRGIKKWTQNTKG